MTRGDGDTGAPPDGGITAIADGCRPAPETLLFERLLRWVAGATLIAALLLCVHETAARRGLAGDGAGFLICVLDKLDFCMSAPARQTVQILQELPTIVALRLGLRDLHAIDLIYGASLNILPLLFVAACWPVLPRSRKAFFFFPLLHYFAGTLTGTFTPIVEGPVAAAYFWLLLFLLLFGRPRLPTLVGLTVLALPTLLLHESMVFLAPVLALVALIRARQAPAGIWRVALRMLAGWLLLVAAVQLRFVLDPASPGNCASWIDGVLHGSWISNNAPACMGLVCIGAMLILAVGEVLGPAMLGRWWARSGRCSLGLLVVIGVAGACIALLVGAAANAGSTNPHGQVAARNNPALLSLPLGLAVLAFVRRPVRDRLWRRRANLAALACLAAGTLGWQVLAVERWSDYLGLLRKVMATRDGLIPWQEALDKAGNDAARVRLATMTWPHYLPALTMEFAPGGRVTAIIAWPPDTPWKPFDPARPEELPAPAFFDTTAYRAALERGN